MYKLCTNHHSIALACDKRRCSRRARLVHITFIKSSLENELAHHITLLALFALLWRIVAFDQLGFGKWQRQTARHEIILLLITLTHEMKPKPSCNYIWHKTNL